MTDNADTTATGRPYWQTPDGKHLAACEERASRERFFPPIPQGSPLHARYESIMLGDEARIYSFTVIHPHPKSGKAPFALVYADFPEKVRVFGIYEGDGRPSIGERVRVVIGAAESGAPRYTFTAAR
jgi:uncharacterized OB-fold protein